jgi:hypothetical protein
VYSLEFPQTKWVLLEEALNFFTRGVSFSRQKATIADIEEAEPKRHSGALLESIPDLLHRRFILDFGHRLGAAAFAERVRLRGIREGDQYEKIPYKFFAKPRALSVHGDGYGPWRDVLVRRDDFLNWIVREYPDCAKMMPSTAVYQTGAPGRRTSRHLVESELRSRATDGLLLPVLSKEAEYLERWLPTAHPNAAPMTKKTIENRIRALYRNLKGQATK